MMTPKEITNALAKIYAAAEPYMEDGVTYYSTPTSSTYGTSGGSLYYEKEDGEKVYLFEDNEDLDDALDFFNISSSFPAYTRLKYTILKGDPIKLEVYTAAMFVKEIEEKLRAKVNSYDHFIKVEANAKLKIRGEKLEIDAVENRSYKEENGIRIGDLDFSSVKDELECLYYLLDGQLEKVYYLFENDQFTFQTLPVIEGLSTPIQKSATKVEIDASNIEEVYALLESGDEDKIAQALEILAQNVAFKTAAEKRYLNLVQARSNNPQADLSQFEEACLSRRESNTFLGKYIAKDFISLSYYDENESKLVVDVIGSLIKNAIDIEAYISEAKKLQTEAELIKLYDKYITKVKEHWAEMSKTYANGWWSKICKKLLELKFERLLFEKTSFEDANKSLVLKEFWFYMNIYKKTDVYLDLHQSSIPDLTEVFWLLPTIPSTNWSDTSAQWPASPLSFQRSGDTKYGDHDSWKKITK
jgi:hypothetical protein